MRVIVHDRSMEPFLAPGDRLYVDPHALESQPPARGDVVVFRDPEGSGRLLIKRVTGLPGDRPPGTRTSVPAKHLFVLGDRLADSHDSRMFGPVPFSLVVGRARFRYAPAGRRGPLDERTFK
ncbi:MAG: S26 family signal peptidase [Thermoplasmata archaeon]|nr:S26 family signal peptidase [Thermoplasmata archaeon]